MRCTILAARSQTQSPDGLHRFGPNRGLQQPATNYAPRAATTRAPRAGDLCPQKYRDGSVGEPHTCHGFAELQSETVPNNSCDK